MDDTLINSPTSARRRLQGTIRHRLILAFEQFRHAERLFLMKALSFSESTYDKQYRRPTKSFSKGVPFIVHPMRVALILIEEIEMRDIGAIASALLHDVV